MGRQSSVYALSPSVREELDRWFVEERQTLDECLSRLAGRGHSISKSALGRYRKALFDGAEDLKTMTVRDVPLGSRVVDALAQSDEELAALLGDLIALQIRQFALLRKVQRRICDLMRETEAKEWVANHIEELVKE